MISFPRSDKIRIFCRALNGSISKGRTDMIDGDICTDNDARHLKKTGIPAKQVHAGKSGGNWQKKLTIERYLIRGIISRLFFIILP